LNRIQTQYATEESFVELTLRIARRNINGDVVEHLTSQFVLNITASEEEVTFSCVDSVATVKAKCDGALVSFSTEQVTTNVEDMQYVYIPTTVEATELGQDFANCGFFYKLLIKDGDDWISWDSMVDILLADNPVLTSEVEFDTSTADFEAMFTKSDYDSHSQYSPLLIRTIQQSQKLLCTSEALSLCLAVPLMEQLLQMLINLPSLISR
jgi:hypothetical protein